MARRTISSLGDPKPATRRKPAKAVGAAAPAVPGVALDPDLAAARKRPSARKSHVEARADAPDEPAYTPREVEAMFARLQAQNPEPKGELDHVNAFTLLVAVVLSAQATDVGVNKATAELFRLADTPQKMLALGEDRVRDLIKTIGLYRNKAKNVILLCEQLVRDHAGEVPNDHAALTRLAGVGRKTANVVLNAAFGVPVIAVDTHIFRVANRIGLAPGKNPDEVEAVLHQVISPAFKLHAHHWLILLGRYVCKAAKPECERCVINDLCKWSGKPEGLPPVEIASL
ncbi:MAG: endonuclease III [Hyphomicrobiaceae bacterium]|nr:endonuclease III [Hyphomicrobiaceae bacterium]